MIPYYTVEKENFREIRAFPKKQKNKTEIEWQKYELPNGKYICQEALPELYIHNWEQQSKKLGHAAHFSTRADRWSSKPPDLYLSLTTHYVDKDDNLQGSCFQTLCILEDHMGQIFSSRSSRCTVKTSYS